MTRNLTRFLALSAGLALLAGCMEPTPYAPRTQGERTGYTDRALTQTRYRVTFTGNSATNRETVETYLLLRAAEVAKAAGYDSFVFDTRNTKAHTVAQVVPEPGPWGHRWGYGGWGGPGWGWRSHWAVGFGYDPNVDIVTRTNYEAYAEIVLLTPDQAAKEPRAVRASEVISRIGPEAAAKPNQT
jgi:hypothetical protein